MVPRDVSWGTGLVLSIGLALSVFLADVVLPVGVVVGIPYVVVVFIASCFLRWGTVVGLALGCTGLTLLGFFGSPPGAPVWIDVTNRALALCTLWATVSLVSHRQRGEAALHQAHAALEQRVVERTTALTHANAALHAALGARQHAEEALAARADRLHTLARLNQLISSSLDRDAVLREIARAAATLTGAPVVHFFIADEATHTLENQTLEAVYPDFPVRTLRFDQGGVGWVATHRQPLNVPAIGDDARFVARDWWQAHGFHSFLGLPILCEDALLAVLAMNGRQPFTLSPEDQALLDSFVAQAAVAIRNASLYATEAQARNAAEVAARVKSEFLAK